MSSLMARATKGCSDRPQEPAVQAVEVRDADPARSPKAWEKKTATQLCIFLGYLQVVATIVVWFAYGTGPVLDKPSDFIIRQFHHAKVMLLPAMLLETCYIWSGRHKGNQLHGYEMSFLVILEYTVKMCCYTTMAHFDGGIVHVNLRAWGPPRGCFTVRYLEWSIAVPTLLAINNYPLLGGSGKSWKEFAQRLLPNLFATWAYILASWLAEVTPDPVSGWFLVILSFAAYLVAIADQLEIVRECQPELEGRFFKITVVIVKEVVFTVYGLFYLLGVWNIISDDQEQAFYTYGDVMLKVAQASILVMVRNWEELEALHNAFEHEVLTNKEDMARLFSRANAPIFTIDSKGFVTGWNGLLARVSRIEEEDALWKPIVDLVSEECRASVATAIESCRQGLLSATVEVTLVGKDMEQPVTLFMNLIMQLSTSADSHIVGIGQDFTELFQLKSIQERKARFTAILGHELRSPLHGIMGLSGSMADEEGNRMKKKQLSMIHSCASRLLDLVTNIMEMSQGERIASNDDDVPAGIPVNVMDIVDEVMEMTASAVDKNGRKLLIAEVQLVNDMKTGELPLVTGDPYKITQVVYNLVTNATKFTKSGYVRLHAEHMPAESMVEIHVEDTGKGIAPEALKRIFQPFEQEDPRDSRSFQGVGLGLSVAQTIVKNHGGVITVKSDVGHGSTFTVRLPCDNNQMACLTMKDDETASAATGALTDQTLPFVGFRAPFSTGRPLVLSVDDEEVNQEVIESALGSDYRIVKAFNGDEALRYLKSGQELPSVMLLDVMMPGLTGFDVASIVRKELKFSHAKLPIMMLSARSPSEATAIEGFNSGTTDYMQKPFNSNILKMRMKVMEEARKCAMGPTSRSMTFDKLPDLGHGAASIDRLSDVASVIDQPPVQKVVVTTSTQTMESGRLSTQVHPVAGAADGTKASDELVKFTEENKALTASLAQLREDRLRLEDRLAQAEAAQKPIAGKSSASVTTDEPEPVPLSTGIPSLYGDQFPGSMSLQSMQFELEAASMSADFYRSEASLCETQMKSLREKLDKHKSEAWLQRHRADALERENTFLKGGLRPRHATTGLFHGAPCRTDRDSLAGSRLASGRTG